MKRILYILALALSIVACTDDIDKSNRYTFTGETVADYMLNRSDKYSHFINLLERAQLLSLLNTYGQYTLFLPDNEAVEKYVQEQDSIYHATKDSDYPVWTGITSPFFEELSDSMATVIARNHVIEASTRMAEMGEGALPERNFNNRLLGVNFVVKDEQYYIMLNKPQGYVSATEDGNDKTVLELLPEKLRGIGLFPCGRLDKNTTGLMLLTDNGELGHKLLAPKNHVSKTYGFKCESELSDGDVRKLETGVYIAGGHLTKPAKIKLFPSRTEGEITITEGKYHQIKFMLEAVKNKITELERLSFGPLTRDENLSRGEWRYLSDDEVEKLEKHCEQ